MIIYYYYLSTYDPIYLGMQIMYERIPFNADTEKNQNRQELTFLFPFLEV